MTGSIKMRFRSAAMAVIAGIAVCSYAQDDIASESYWALLKDDGQTWCAYANANEFQADAANPTPIESAKVTYSAGKLSEVTHQIEPRSGDWVVIDEYTPLTDGATLKRTNLLMAAKLRVVQQAKILGGRVEPFEIASVHTLPGKPTHLPPDVDFPQVSASADPSTLAFVELAGELRGRSLGKLCKKIG